MVKYSGLRVCVDSGKHRIAWALGDDRSVLSAGLYRTDLKTTSVLTPIPNVLTVIQEVPVSYKVGRGRRRAKRVDPNDLIAIACRSGWFCGAIAPGAQYVPIPPREWKGTINGDVFLTRIANRLTPAEVAVLEGTGVCDSLLHNVIDAMGMVLWTQGRI